MHTKAKFLMEHGDQFGFAGKRNLADNIFSTDFSALGGLASSTSICHTFSQAQSFLSN